MQTKKNYDSEFCGSLPLHFINQIQPHGILLVLDKNNLEILQASENTLQHLGYPAPEIVKKKLDQYTRPGQLESIQQKIENTHLQKLPVSIRFSTTNGDRNFLGIVQLKEQFILMELEPEAIEDNLDNSFTGIYQHVKQVMARIEATTSLEELCETAATELKKISGFDKIMIYRFDEQWNGIVVGEAMEKGWDSYMGLRFPASDIPKQARQLYQRNAYRLIPNREYTPVKLYPVINPVTSGFTDLSDCNLRSVAGVHLEYLKNMKVTASMSTRLLIHDKLWGLIACHHATPKYASYILCSVFELLSTVIANRISSLEHYASFDQTTRLQQLHNNLMEQVYKTDNLDKALLQNGELEDFLNCDGIAIVHKNEIATKGNVPSQDQMDELVFWLHSNKTENMYHETNLGSQFEQALQYADIGSGIIVLPIQPEKGEYIIGFRPEVVQQIDWSGNPNEAIRFEADKKNYHPRNSFQIWKETVKHSSLPWQQEELEAADQLRNSLVQYTLQQYNSR